MKIEVKQRSGDTDIGNISDKSEAEKIAKCYIAGKKDEESKLEKINFKELAIRSEKESKTTEAATTAVL